MNSSFSANISEEGGHGGNIHKLARRRGSNTALVDFSANINPLGPPSWLRATISRSVADVIHYPDPDCHKLVEAIAAHYRVAREQVIPANGTTELLYHLPRVLSRSRAVIPVPCYIDYRKVMDLNGVEVVEYPLLKKNNFALETDELAEIVMEDDIVIFASPNNPTGMVVNHEKIQQLAAAFPRAWFVIDEAFLDFVEGTKSVAGKADNIITLHSLTKFYAVPGIRLGFGVFPQPVAQELLKVLPPWSVNSFAQEIGAKVFSDTEYFRKTVTTVMSLRKNLADGLGRFEELELFPSSANYLLIHLRGDSNAHQLSEKLLEHGIAIRVCSNYSGLDEHYFRVAVKSELENERLINAMSDVFEKPKPRNRLERKAKSLMIQGTSSNAGKSVLVAALCRLLVQDGYRVAPFKAQNMSLNSFVTHDGLEMGRAQVVQAQAAKLDPEVNMNPILLKPNSDVGSQVIVHGKPVGNMAVREYVAYKAEAIKMAHQSYDALAAEYDLLVLEGAGSPGEVNLKHHDIVNMRMAEYAQSPVLLVGDIDRGGVYASFIGTMEVLEEWERKLVAGFLVNRFRGDSSLLQPAHDYLFEHSGKPVMGVIPNISDLGIPEEDSVSFKAGKLQKERPRGDHVEVALINLPHISNFTDVEPFLDEPDVFLNIVNSPEELGTPDAVILPGSKNVYGDMRFLRDSALDQAVCKAADEGREIVGICGGYQMLGKAVHDPHRIESDNDRFSGMGILDIETTLAREKTLTRKNGVHLDSGLGVYGYEIHHGISSGRDRALLEFEDGSSCGTRHERYPIWGAYLHGIFDDDSFRRWFIDALRVRRNLPAVGRVMAPYNLERAFDSLAEIVRSNIDMEKLYELLDLS